LILYRKTAAVAFAYGVDPKGRPNIIIGQIADSKLSDKTVSKVYALPYIEIHFPHYEAVEYFKENADDPLSTLEVAREAVRKASNEGVTELWVIAARQQLQRCFRDLKMAVKQSGAKIKVNYFDESKYYPWKDWSSPNDPQKRVRSWWKFLLLYEIPLRALPFFAYQWLLESKKPWISYLRKLVRW